MFQVTFTIKRKRKINAFQKFAFIFFLRLIEYEFLVRIFASVMISMGMLFLRKRLT